MELITAICEDPPGLWGLAATFWRLIIVSCGVQRFLLQRVWIRSLHTALLQRRISGILMKQSRHLMCLRCEIDSSQHSLYPTCRGRCHLSVDSSHFLICLHSVKLGDATRSLCLWSVHVMFRIFFQGHFDWTVHLDYSCLVRTNSHDSLQQHHNDFIISLTSCRVFVYYILKPPCCEWM